MPPALDNLRLGHIVLADCVNPLTLTRNAWQDVAVKAGSGLLEVELICSDPQIHRARVEGRQAKFRVCLCRIGRPCWSGTMKSGSARPWC